MYKELISELSKDNDYVKIQPPCPESEIKRAEKAVGYPFPKELRALLRELDGDKWLLLSAKEITEQAELNKSMRSFYEREFGEGAYEERLGRLLFFAGNGCGDYYCYRADKDGVIDESTIYIWMHEDMGEECCWEKVASSMTELITRYYNGEI
ncbi:MAG: SMI1/KNR4 family protein [Lachnospiraceae bacterium]|nr:SMI1/KNR4 family protein [Ruminococcus sp.]MCM1274628.1 SMI1/KNR4 family protein [Lachnospiraceae bacterium]